MKKFCAFAILLALSARMLAVDPVLVAMNKGSHYARLSEHKDMLLRGDYKTGVEDTLLMFSKMKGKSLQQVEAFRFSPQEDRILLRVSDKNYYVYNVDRKQCAALSQTGSQATPAFSHTGKLVSFVRNNDVFVRNLANGNEEWQITFDGTEAQKGGNKPFIRQAFGTGAISVFAPDDDYLVYAKNHRTYIYHFQKKTTYELTLPDTDIYITRLAWTQVHNQFVVMYLNGSQKTLNMVLVNADNRSVRKIYHYTSSRNISPENASFVLIPDKKHFAVLQERNAHTHLHFYTLDGAHLFQMADGGFDVTKVYGYDSKTSTLYYQSNENGKMSRGVYSINVDGVKRNLATKVGTNDASFSSDFSYFELSYSNREQPHTYSVVDNRGHILRELCQDSFDPSIERKEIAFNDSVSGWVLYKKGISKAPLMLSVTDERNQWMQDIAYYMASQGFVVAGINNNKSRCDCFVKSALYNGVAARNLIYSGLVDERNVFILGNRLSGGIVLAAMMKEESLISGAVIISPLSGINDLGNVDLNKCAETFNGLLENPTYKYDLLLLHAINDGPNSEENTNRMVEQLTNAGVNVQIHTFPVRDESFTASLLQPSIYNRVLTYFKSKLKR